MFTIDRARSSKPMGVETLIYYLHCENDLLSRAVARAEPEVVIDGGST